MSSATVADTGQAAASSAAGRIGRVLMWVAAASAAVAAASAAGMVVESEAAVRVVETWRAYGLVVFAGLFALLAWRPQAYRGVWELVIFHKLALTLTAVGYAVAGDVPGTGQILVWDGGLSVLLVVAYLLCRGWRSGARG
ncbi:hypothetical protein C1I95_27900 [Micromonospora craterilacus]|uniref:Uncharacterized protein n=1 Tax=Micromonospora craterilacus TaxID=1655439 RepID=A0A2W2F3E9_9ACTN|nr:hypothetical protein [Micromonospora craterilacus]PZG10604.1 hypothetical protein C1I95_27900 [Micromonospora craterilacus]